MKPRKKELHMEIKTGLQSHENYVRDGYNSACSDWEKWIKEAKIEDCIDKWMPCTCIEDYTKRGRTAPDCANHNHKDDLVDGVRKLLLDMDKERIG